MSIVALGFVIASIAGPAMRANATKNDLLIEQALPSLVYDINDYARTYDKLPEKLSDVKSYSGEELAQVIVEKNLVTYKPNTKPATADQSVMDGTDVSSARKDTTVAPNTQTSLSKDKTFYYQLCVTYKEARNSRYNYGSKYGNDDDYSRSISTTTHEKGDVCYGVSTEGKYSYATY
jgi:hypothetical protein